MTQDHMQSLIDLLDTTKIMLVTDFKKNYVNILKNIKIAKELLEKCKEFEKIAKGIEIK